MEIRTVLCPVDFSGETGLELALAKQVCSRFGARLVVEHNLDPRPPNFLTVTWMWSEEFEGEEEQKLGTAQKKLKGLLDELSETLTCEAKLTRGPIDDVLLLLAKELPADLLVMGSHGWSTAEHQSLTEEMISKCPIPVLTTGNSTDPDARLFSDDAEAPATRILATVDDDRGLEPAVAYAAGLAEQTNAELTLLEVLKRSDETRVRRAEERLGELISGPVGERVKRRAVEGNEVEIVLAEAKSGQLDLIVRPVHGGVMPWTKKDRQADFDLLHLSPCPVLFVPSKFEVG